MAVDEEGLLAEQLAYYRARAPEYDDWFLRRGRYDKGPESSARWAAEVDAIRAQLDRVDLGGSVLELAPGTGWWTAELVERVESVTAVDASPEVLALNQARVGAGRVDYIRADIFDWEPHTRFDAVFFSFWLSHVPPGRFETFWDLVARCVRPGGPVFFVDSRRHREYQWSDGRRVEVADGPAGHRVTRELSDGRQFDIVKVFYEPVDLLTRLESLGWTGQVTETDEFFLWGCVRLAATRG